MANDFIPDTDFGNFDQRSRVWMNGRHYILDGGKKMINRKAFVVFGLALASLIAFSGARASEIDQATKLPFNQSVQIPGQVLPAGTYFFVALPPETFQIFSSV